MHLAKLPTIFVKGGEERKVYFTIQAKELIAAGWVEKDEENTVKQEPPVEEAPKEVAKEVKTRTSKPKAETKTVSAEDEIKIDE